MRFESSADVDGSPEVVFWLTQDYSKRLTWDPFLRSASLLGGATAPAVGVRAWCVTHRGLGMETEYVSFAPPRIAAVKMTRGPKLLESFGGAWEFAPIDGARTSVTFRYQLRARPRFLAWLLEPAARWWFARETRRRVEALQEALRSASAPGSMRERVRDEVDRLDGPGAADAWHSLVELGAPALPVRVEIRHETPRDAPRVDRLLREAFGQDAEARLVAKLRQVDGALSLVATIHDELLGHVLFSPVTARGASTTVRASGLAPVSVLPAWQRRGIGTQLIRSGIARLRSDGIGLVVVLGHASYYPRFGFVPASTLGLACKWGGEDGSFQALELVPDAAKEYRGVVDYHPLFDETAW